VWKEDLRLLMWTDPFRDLDRLTQQVFGLSPVPPPRRWTATARTWTSPVRQAAKPRKLAITTTDVDNRPSPDPDRLNG
jgi:hypothetical protein